MKRSAKKILRFLILGIVALVFGGSSSTGCFPELRRLSSKAKVEMQTFWLTDTTKERPKTEDSPKPDNPNRKKGKKEGCQNLFSELRFGGAHVLYVKPTPRSANPDCRTWQSACSLKEALQKFRDIRNSAILAEAKVYVIVAKGIYTTASENLAQEDSVLSFLGGKNFELRGGFDVDDDCLEDGDQALPSTTLLDGQKHSNTVVSLLSTDEIDDVEFRNFGIQGGRALKKSQSGAGLSLTGVKKVTNLRLGKLSFQDNHAADKGGCFAVGGDIDDLRLWGIEAKDCFAKRGGGAGHIGGKIKHLRGDGFSLSHSHATEAEADGGGLLLSGRIESGLFEDIKIHDCDAKGSGGGMFVREREAEPSGSVIEMGKLRFLLTRFNNNTAQKNGGAVAIASKGVVTPAGPVTITSQDDYRFIFRAPEAANNNADQGGGFDIEAQSVLIEDGVLSGNKAKNDCGGGRLHDVLALSLTDLSIKGNNALGGDGGGLCFMNSTVINHKGVTYVDNHAKGGSKGDGNGGAILALKNLLVDEKFPLESITCQSNTASGKGGCAYLHSASAEVVGGKYEGNIVGDLTLAKGEGGAIWYNGKRLVLKGNVELNDNRSGNVGGAISASFLSAMGTELSLKSDGISRVIFSANKARGKGSAIHTSLSPKTLDLTGALFHRNQNVSSTLSLSEGSTVYATAITTLITSNQTWKRDNQAAPKYISATPPTEFLNNKGGPALHIGSITNPVTLRGKYIGNIGGAVYFGQLAPYFYVRGEKALLALDDGFQQTDPGKPEERVLFSKNTAKSNPVIHFSQVDKTSPLPALEEINMERVDFKENANWQIGVSQPTGLFDIQKPLKRLTFNIGEATGNKQITSSMVRGGFMALLGGVTEKLSIQRFTFADHEVTGEGGVFYVGDDAKGATPEIILIDSHFVNNSAGVLGGALHISNAKDIEILGCTLSKNHANGGGALSVTGFVNEFKVTQSSLVDNTSENEGGAIRIAQAGRLEIKGKHSFRDFYQTILARVEGRYPTDVPADKSALERMGGDWIKNSAYNGGAIYVGSLGLTHPASSSLIENQFWGKNSSNGEGGGLFIAMLGHPLVVDDNIFFKNSAKAHGGWGFISTIPGNSVTLKASATYALPNDPAYPINPKAIIPLGQALLSGLNQLNDLGRRHAGFLMRFFAVENNELRESNNGDCSILHIASDPKKGPPAIANVENMTFAGNRPTGSAGAAPGFIPNFDGLITPAAVKNLQGYNVVYPAKLPYKADQP